MAKRALISVSDKSGIDVFAKQLAELGVEIISTGGTAKLLKEKGIDVIGISDITGFPECLDGRVKTLHPNVHAGLLAMRDNPEHMKQLEELKVQTIDFVVVNLYPFKNTILKEGVTFAEAIENIDIGGPTMLRSAAKNFKDVAVITDPRDYDKVIEELKENGEVTYDTKLYLANKVFALTSYYDTLISDYLKKVRGDESFPENLTLAYDKAQDLRYGENPHQNAVFYKEITGTYGSLSTAKQLWGKELSYNNINDTNGALEILKDFAGETTVVAVKHSNPCGVASADNIYDAFLNCYNADPTSIFGGIIATNAVIDEATAEKMNEIFLEVVVAPGYTEGALKVFERKKNIRLLELEGIEFNDYRYETKKVLGGVLLQERDRKLYEKLEVVTDRAPSEKEMEDLIFGWKAVKNTKSNAISLAKDKILIANGPGQTSRIWALENAIKQANMPTQGAVLASDAFFPFDDCVEAAHAAGITAIIQPGGSTNDQASIDKCNEYGIAMIFTGTRHFKHS
ncbi:MAG: bifunctional phosphoribosylaminoimidazolecarboxamide formyltransferase/IMP cyclohydrolase [Eubacteriaceae bacterium]|nr:bifunctional phosphoribosylaminoimidazolecarboxamide formyltransferase/IMP cyclohydrolase [Eubacteriaceae bacterium]